MCHSIHVAVNTWLNCSFLYINHIKTLMLWACELKPTSWWTENLNVVRVCAELLQTLSVWLTDSRCSHYFIYNCNLLDKSSNVRSVASKLMLINEEYLSTWLINKYIGQCAQLCPIHILGLYGDVSSTIELENVASVIINWRLNTSLYDMWEEAVYGEYIIAGRLPHSSVTTRQCAYWMNELAKIDHRFSIYFSAIGLLHIARKISRNSVDMDVLDIVAITLGNNVNQYSCSVLSERNTSEVVEFLQKSAVERLTTYRQLMSRDFGSVAAIVTTDFEALYAYKQGDYQRCLHLSTENVHPVLYDGYVHTVPTLPDFIQLLDDDIVSLTALTLIVDPKCRIVSCYSCISQLTLSLYLTTQCQLKLHHSVTSLAQTLHYIEVEQRRHSREYTLDHLTLRLIERKVYLTISHRNWWLAHYTKWPNF